MDYNAQQFSSLFETPLGQSLWRYLNEPENLIRMQTATYLSRPALEPMSPILEVAFGVAAFEDRTKQMVGHMIRQIMEAQGFNLDRTGVRITTIGNKFASGARYK